MKSTIEEIYYNPQPYIETAGRSEAYEKAEDKMVEKRRLLEESFNGHQKKLFSDYWDADTETESEAYFDHFKAGFKLGLLMGIEVNE